MQSDVPLKIDHFVIVVADLDQAISNFTELGFIVAVSYTHLTLPTTPYV